MRLTQMAQSPPPAPFCGSDRALGASYVHNGAAGRYEGDLHSETGWVGLFTLAHVCLSV